MTIDDVPFRKKPTRAEIAQNYNRFKNTAEGIAAESRRAEVRAAEKAERERLEAEQKQRERLARKLYGPEWARMSRMQLHHLMMHQRYHDALYIEEIREWRRIGAIKHVKADEMIAEYLEGVRYDQWQQIAWLRIKPKVKLP